jgi:hypothetical protein
MDLFVRRTQSCIVDNGKMSLLSGSVKRLFVKPLLAA